jgi:adenylate cyclase
VTRVWSNPQRLRAVLVLGVGAVLTGLVMLLAVTDPLRQLELDTVDARFGLRGNQPPPRDIVDVNIDARTFQALQEQWPFPRKIHARVIDELRRAGAKAIAYDVQFTEPTTPRQDEALMSAVGRAKGRIVLATSEVNEFGESAIFGGEATLKSLGARSGNALFTPDADGIIRRIPTRVDGLKSLALATAEVAEHRPIPAAELGGASPWIDFHGEPGTVTSVSLSDVYDGRVDRALFRDKVVVVGATATSLQDDTPTSAAAEEPMSGVETHANGISTILRGTPLDEAGMGIRLALVALLGMVVPAVAVRRRSRRGVRTFLLAILLALGVGAIYLIAARVAFGAGLILPIVYPLLALFVSMVGVAQVELTTTVIERDRVRERFARFVPERIVDDVLSAADDDLCLGGVRVQSTVVFCDLRDFTAFAELRPADQVIDTLNCYLSEMSEAIRARGGTLVDYQGDGIVAAFGAPLEQVDHADRALDAVRDMAGPRLDALNAWVRRHNVGPGFRIGIGVNSGIVMSGNVGCKFRLEYTVIGDTANTASRLESMTKQLPHQVLISDSTRAMLRSEPTDLVYVDAVEIRGKQVKTILWTLDAAPTREEAEEVAAVQPAAVADEQ